MLTPYKIAALCVALLILAGAFLAYRQSLIQQGWDKALRTVEQENDAARAAARKAQRSVDACYDAGGLWSTLTGECDR